MKEKELARFHYEGYEYHIAHQIYQYESYRVSYPSISVTNKSSNKKKDKFTEKYARQNKLTNLENPYPLIKKILKIFEDGFKDCEYICFTAYNEKQDKRQRVYKYYLNKMGFKSIYCGKDYFFFAREGYEIKKKEVNTILWGMYHELEQI